MYAISEHNGSASLAWNPDKTEVPRIVIDNLPGKDKAKEVSEALATAFKAGLELGRLNL